MSLVNPKQTFGREICQCTFANMTQSNAQEGGKKMFAFVNVDSPEQLKTQETRKLVNQHVGKFHRNRSMPAQRAKLRNNRPKTSIFASTNACASNENSPNDCWRSGNRLVLSHRDVDRCKQSHTQQDSESTPYKSSQYHDRQKSFQDEKSVLNVLTVRPQWHDEIDVSGRYLGDGLISGADEDSDRELDALRRTWKYSVINNLGQSRRDPFGHFTVDDPDDRVSILVDHAVQHFWWGMMPDGKSGATHPVNNDYLMHMRSSPMAYFTYIIVISSHLDYLWATNPMKKNYEALRAKNMHAATRLVRKIIRDMPDDPSGEYVTDELVGSVMALCANHQINVVSRESWPSSAFRSPLATAQFIDMWGAVPFIQPHRLAVVRLIELRGGLDKLGSSHLAGVVQLCDLIDASRKTERPMLPYRNLILPLTKLTWPVAVPEDLAYTSAFLQLPFDIMNRHNLKTTVAAITHTTILLATYHQQRCPATSMGSLVESRNRAQHMTLSLPSAFSNDVHCATNQRHLCSVQESTFDTVSAHMYETIRLSLLIYNNIVVYPMPPASGVGIRLAKSLQSNLSSLFDLDPSVKMRHLSLLLWSLMLGGISEYDKGRIWYQEQFNKLFLWQTRCRKWLYMESLLSSFLWSDVVLNEEAIKFWSECMRADATTSPEPCSVKNGWFR